MIPRYIVPTLLALVIILMVTFTAVMGGYAITAAVGDAIGAAVFWWAGMVSLILLIVDGMLLLLSLAIIHVDDSVRKAESMKSGGHGRQAVDGELGTERDA